MKLATIKLKDKEEGAVISEDRATLIQIINEYAGEKWSTNLFELLQTNQLTDLKNWYKNGGESRLSHLPTILAEDTAFAPLYRQPRKICGVGMNYLDKAIELSGRPPEAEPIIFMKPDTSLIGPNDSIILPPQANVVTAEAELAIIIGKTCKNIDEASASSFVAGFTTAIDVTAKDIHANNPRFLQRAKSFDTFFSFGPYFITTDEFTHLKDITVETTLNGEVTHRNVVANMMYPPWFIVSYFSHIMTLHPGDIILTGTPGSVVIKHGDIVECQINGFKLLSNSVTRRY
ncbi:fumarylacetoacetate hydrolase [Bacillus sp. SA1-12]|uniref:fumarylacetoacetate hydrolase family protein n=1 Tax=Bacillus sp. SA1-12 TaxID=1455638 RepID=UPI000626F4E8|nr:fumarylacetoacetate hydrolase family protein [Bacillus sp. SA1-12]KKI90440.1 fumarylacetoacetate hydrolase [Bacillus sp. SA1-12]